MKQLGVHDNFFHIGGHSLLAVRMLAKAQQALKKVVPLAAVFRAPTIAALAEQFQSEPKNISELLEPVRTAGDGAAVFCVGGRLIEHLAEVVPSTHPLYWCKPEHFDGRRVESLTVEQIAACYCREISAATIQGPYVLCGFSYGGLVAFETARQLYERDPTPILLLLLEPCLAQPKKEARGSRIAHHLRRVVSLPPRQWASYVLGRASASVRLLRGRIKDLYCGARLAIGLPIPVKMRWEYVEDLYNEATQNYVPQPFPGTLVLVRGPKYSEDEVARWAKLCPTGCSVSHVQCEGHLELATDRQSVAQWAELLKLHLNRLSDAKTNGMSTDVQTTSAPYATATT